MAIIKVLALVWVFVLSLVVVGGLDECTRLDIITDFVSIIFLLLLSLL